MERPVDVPVFNALNFSVDDPFYYRYEYASTGLDTNAQFSATAQGDLDCDGTWSAFTRTGTVLSDRSVSGGSGIYSINETE